MRLQATAVACSGDFGHCLLSNSGQLAQCGGNLAPQDLPRGHREDKGDCCAVDGDANPSERSAPQALALQHCFSSVTVAHQRHGSHHHTKGDLHVSVRGRPGGGSAADPAGWRE